MNATSHFQPRPILRHAVAGIASNTVRSDDEIAEDEEKASGRMTAPQWPGHSARSLQSSNASANRAVFAIFTFVCAAFLSMASIAPAAPIDESYQYDALNRLTTAGAATYQHDAAGNLVQMTAPSTPSLFVTPSTTTMAYQANNTAIVSLTANVSWTANSNQTWLTVSPASGTTGTTLTLTSTTQNPTTSARSATITITDGSLTSQVTVTQEGAPPPDTLVLSLTGLTIPSSATSSSSFAVTTTGAWSASSNQSWLTLTSASGTGNGTVTFNVTANDTASPRTATVTVTSNALTAQYILNQQASIAQAVAVNVRILGPSSSFAFQDAAAIAVELNNMLAAASGYSGSSAAATVLSGNTLTEAYYHPSYRTATRAALAGSYTHLVILPETEFLNSYPEMTFDGVLQMSRKALPVGATPLLLMPGVSASYVNTLGTNGYRIANGCGIDALPGGYATQTGNLLAPGTALDQQRQAYLLAAMVFTKITGLNAATGSTYVSTYSGTPLDVANLASVAASTLTTHRSTVHYSTSRENSGLIRYRTITPPGGVVRYAWAGTSTEAGINAAMPAILQASGYTVGNYQVNGTWGWSDATTTAAATNFNTYPGQYQFAYARDMDTTATGQSVINVNQANLLPIVYDQHYVPVTNNDAALDDIYSRIEEVRAKCLSLGWVTVPVHLGVARLNDVDPSILFSSNTTHWTAPVYSMICAMMATSSLGSDPTPTAAILENSQQLNGFNVGKQIIKQLAFLSETEAYVPDTTLAVVASPALEAVQGLAFNYSLTATGGSAPYTWSEESITGLPAGLTLSSNGNFSGIATANAGTWQLVVKVKDNTGAIRKTPVTLIVLPATTTALSLTIGSTPANPGTPLTFTATVSGTSPTGDVTFFADSTLLGTSALNGSSQASLTTNSLAVGSYNITAQYNGNATNAASTSNALAIDITSNLPTEQTITFETLADVFDNAAPFALSATASSGLTVSYTSSNPSVATVSGNTVTVVGPGSTTLTASQSGDANYNAASSVQQTLNVLRTNPLAVSGGPYRVFFGQSLSLNGSGCQPSNGQIITLYEWDLNNDGTFDINGATPSIISFVTLTGTWGMVEGLNTIQLKITDSSNKISIVSTTVKLMRNLTWDANGASADQTNGSGAWLDTDLWWDGTANQTWTTGSNATFGGPNTAGGDVTLASPTTVDSLTFNSFTGTYTLGTAGQALTINGSMILNNTASAVTLNSPVILGSSQTWMNNSSGRLTLSSTLDNGGNLLTLDGSGATTLKAGTISGSGGLTKNGSGFCEIGGQFSAMTHTYTGTTTINGGVLRVIGDTTLGNLGSGNLTINGGVLEYYFTGAFSRTLGAGAGEVQLLGGDSGFGCGSGATFTLNNNAAYEVIWGSAYFNPTTLVLNAATSVGMTNFANKLDFNGTTRTIQVNAGTARISGVIGTSTGTAGLIKTGNGTLAIDATNTYNGDTTISSGNLRVGSAGTLGNGNYAGNISVASGAALQIWSTAAQTLGGTISGDGSLVKAYAGSLTLSDSNTYTGKTTIIPLSTAGAGTLSVSSFNSVTTDEGLGLVHSATSSLGAPTTEANGTIDFGSMAVQGSATLKYTGNGETTDRIINFLFNGTGATKVLDTSGVGLLKFTSLFTGSGSTTNDIALQGTSNGEIVGGLPFEFLNLYKSGSGTWTLGGTCLHTGTTTVATGKLFITGSLSNTAAALNVVNGATLGGTGIIGRNVTIASGGKLEFDISTNAASHIGLDISTGRSFTFSGASELNITCNGGAAPGTYTLITGGNNITGIAPATVNLPDGWVATVSISGNSLLLNVTSTGAVYMVTFDANGGSAPSPTSKSVTHNAAYGTLATTSRTGYTLNGWFTAASGGTLITSLTSVTTAANHTLHAQWTANTYTVTFDAQGGTGGSAPANQTKTHDITLTLSGPGTLIRTGYSFAGWNTAANGSGAAYAPGASYTANAVVTLYAQWNAIPMVSAGTDQSVTLSVSNAWTPAQLTPQLWLDATTATVNAGNVSMVNAGSGGGTISGPAALAANGIGTLQAVQFNGSSQYLTGNYTNTGTTLTAFFVGKSLNSTQTAYAGMMAVWANAQANDWNNIGSAVLFNQNNTTANSIYSYRNTTPLSSSSGTLTSSFLAATSFNGTINTVYLNGTAATGVASSGSFNAAKVSLGGRWTSPGFANYWNGNFGEAIICNTSLSASDRQKIEGYLAHKWSLAGSLPIDHPYKSLPPTNTSAVANLDGTVSDLDSVPTTTWTVVSGPGSVLFGNATAVDTTATFTVAGTYTLRLTATDPGASPTDDVVITVGNVPENIVSYNGNSNTGGTAPTNQVKSTGVNLTLATNSGGLVRDGYTYAGWNTAANGTGTDYAAGATYTTDANLALFAKWTPNTYTVTFDAQGGTGGSGSVTATYGSAMLAATAPTRAGYTFGGYFSAISGGGTQYYTAAMASATNWNVAANLTLYAKWTTAYVLWAGEGKPFNGDSNGDGLADGLAWVLGAASPGLNATALLPALDNATDPNYFIYTYRRTDAAYADPQTTIVVEYGNDIGSWTSAAYDPLNPDNIIITPSNDSYGPGVDKVEVKIKRTLAPSGKLFSRLKVVITP